VTAQVPSNIAPGDSGKVATDAEVRHARTCGL
jgi:hypothetical protein